MTQPEEDGVTPQHQGAKYGHEGAGPQLPKRPKEGEQSRPRQYKGGEAQDDEREPEQLAEQRPPEDLGHRIMGAPLQHPQRAGLQEVLHAPRIRPIIDDGDLDRHPREENGHQHDCGDAQQGPAVCHSYLTEVTNMRVRGECGVRHELLT